jgi:hypothetical protein
MPLTAYVPLDPERFRRDNRSVAYSPLLPAGAYVYIQDCSGTVWILPDGTHRHPHVLGRARPAVAAGELITGENGEVLSINNLSGTLSVRFGQFAHGSGRTRQARSEDFCRRDYNL